MKKIVIWILSVLIASSIVTAFMYVTKINPESENNKSKQKIENTEKKSDNAAAESNSKTETVESDSNKTEAKDAEQKDGYDIIVSEKNITIEKGSKASFDITFTNPDESSIREYIKCEDQHDIIIVSYSMLEDKKITVDVEGLKVGTTLIAISDYNYPNKKEIVKVNVVEKN